MATIYQAAVIGVGAAQNSGKKGGGHQIGYSHGRAYTSHPRTQVACGADINPENLAAFVEKFGGEGFDDHRTMLEKARPDIVSICTYMGLHRTMIEDCARAGVKGILCEKPFVSSPAELDEVLSIAQETGVKIVIAHIRRHLPAFVFARDRYLDGSLGEPLMCLAGLPNWDLSEWGSHWLDMFRFFHDDKPVQWVFGQARVRDGRGYGHAMEDHAVAYLQFEGGGRGLLDGGSAMNGGDWDMTLVGTQGTLRIQGEKHVTIDGAAGRETHSFAADYPAVWQATVNDLVQWIDGGDVPRTGLPRVAASAELNLAAYLSAVRGDRIDLPLNDTDRAFDQWPVQVLADRHAGK